MNNEQIMAELESAAKIIMAPPNLVSNEQRHSAEAIFLNLRSCKSPFVLCKQILDTCKDPYVLFEAAETLKGALIREWSFLLDSDRMSLRQYLMHYVTNNTVPAYVSDRLLQVIAIMVKRGSAEDGGRDRGVLLQEIENIILNGESDQKVLAFHMITSLMQEYATTVRSTDVGLPWEIHVKVKKNFESTDLKRIFKFCVQLLSEVVKSEPPYSANMLTLLGQILKVTEGVLTWGYISSFLRKRLFGIYEAVYEADQPTLRLSEAWADIILAPQFLPLMFQIFWKFKDQEPLSQHAIICLVQLASLNGAILTQDDVRFEYLQNYLNNFSQLVSSINVEYKEALGISTIVKKLILFYINDIQKLPEQTQNTYLDELTRLTCVFCKGCTFSEPETVAWSQYNDALDNMMEAWTSIMQEYSSKPNTALEECARQIFDNYVQHHLGPPDGSRQNSDSDLVTEIEDNEDEDRIYFKEQLQTIGMFGRIIPNHSLPLLIKLLEMNIEKLKSHLQLLQNRAMHMAESNALDGLFEDLHWTVLVAGHTLCMDSDGETPMIPMEMMQHSIDQYDGKKSTLEASMACLASAVRIDADDRSQQLMEQCDHVVRIVVALMRLCVLENSAAEAKLGHFMSPQVSSTVMWFMKRWCLSYLLPVENYYQKVSQVIVGLVGRDTEGAAFVVNFVLDKIYSNICHFNSEPVLLRDTVDLLTALACIRQKQSLCVVKSKSLWNLIELQEKMGPGQLSTAIRRDLFKCFILAGLGLRDPVEMKGYFERILQPLQTKFNGVGAEGVRTNCHKDEVQKELADVLECFIGIAKGAHMTTVEILFRFLAPNLAQMPKVLTLFNNYQVIVHLILELFGQCARNMLCYLTQQDSRRMYESTLATVEAYAKANSNKLSVESLAEENNFNDIVLILDLLTFIVSKDCIDLCPSNDEDVTVTASDVSLFGLNFIMPLMTLDLLKFPTLCSQYYRLLVLINDIYPEKICALPSNLFAQLLNSVEMGLTQFGSDITQACLDFVQCMASYFYKNSLQSSPVCESLRPYMKLLLDLTLGHQINSDLMSSASTCVYSLICCYGDEYKTLVDALVNAQTDTLVRERLATAFHNLTVNVAMNGERQSKLKFRDNFDRFIANVHGFLLVK